MDMGYTPPTPVRQNSRRSEEESDDRSIPLLHMEKEEELVEPTRVEVMEAMSRVTSTDELVGGGLNEKSFSFFQVGRDFEASNVAHKFTMDERRKMCKFEGLDYYKEENIVYKEHVEEKEEVTNTSKWIMFMMIGLAVGATAFVLFQTIEWLHEKRTDWTLDIINPEDHGTYLEAYLVFVGSGAALTMASSFLVVFIAPAAAGSGVPDVMGYLNGVLVPHVFNVKTFIVKFISCVFAVGSGLPVGPEGPIIHIGALLGAGLPMGRSRTMGWVGGGMGSAIDKWFSQFREAKEQRDFITGGAAAGVSAAFSAPVGGLLFVFEEVASFWEPRLTWMVFFACLMSAFANSFFSSPFSAWDHTGTFGYFDDKMDVMFPLNSGNARFHILAMIPTVAIGLLGGFLGSVFTFFNLKIVRMRIKFVKKPLLKVLEPTAVCVAFLSIMFVLGVTGGCKEVPKHLGCEEGTENGLPSCEWLVREVCKKREGKDMYSPMATLTFASGDALVKHMFTSPDLGTETGMMELFTYLLVYICFACWCAGMAISSGLVIPMLITGSVMGRFCGRVLNLITDASWADTSIFALVGASSFFGGVSRLTVSLAVIILEISGAMHFLLPIMASILIAKWVADFATHSLYHALLEVKCVPFLDFLCDIPKMDCFQAADIMKTNVMTLPAKVTLGELVRILNKCTHNGFPVVLMDDRTGRKVFKGIVLRSQLASVIKLAMEEGAGIEGSVQEPPGSPTSPTGSPIKYKEFKEGVDTVIYERLGVPQPPQHMKGYIIDLGPVVNTSSFHVNQSFAISIVRNLFRTMALRHLPVTNDYNEVVGMITRKDLIGQAIEEGMKRAKNKVYRTAE
eukprot:TRINITY_DN9986_c0_g1_i1.p1 TRINITY_DN9986_c0_g1~~TRINITY_DN9986_c0_g1_i1.p1  ORF type:complete len:848 (+),score=226.65 TRINITY_DN9986_c0_g1_i1:45-2588(+)